MAFELDLKQINRGFREKLAAVSLVLIFAAGFSWAWLDDAWVFGHTGDVRHTVAEVIDLQKQELPERWVASFAFATADGTPRTAEERFDRPPPFAVGDRVPFVHSVTGRSMARLVKSDDQTILQVLLGIGLALWALYLAMLAHVLRPYLRKRRLLMHGVPEVLSSARVETSVYAMVEPPIPTWRLCASQFDASLPGWREYCSDWQKGSPPTVAADTPLPPLLRDPAQPSRHWLPVVTWAAKLGAPP